ncbi:MAG: hypothetical protein ACREJD_04040 [Phycisphaerales bacterium]
MAIVDFVARNFQKGAGFAIIPSADEVRKSLFYWSLISAGATGRADLKKFGARSFHRAKSLFLLADCMIDWPASSDSSVSSMFRQCDRSEKAIVSYHVGMGLTKCFAWKGLGIRWLMHVDRAAHLHHLTFGTGRSRPDLLGLDKIKSWHVVEAKGRSDVIEKGLAKAAKAQASRVVTVNALPPASAFSSITHLKYSPLSVSFDDPRPRKDEQRQFQWSINIEDFLQAYYATFQDWFAVSKLTRRVNDVDFRMISFAVRRDGVNKRIEIGMASSLLSRPENAFEILPRMPQIELDNNEGVFIGPDGLLIRES